MGWGEGCEEEEDDEEVQTEMEVCKLCGGGGVMGRGEGCEEEESAESDVGGGGG